MSLKVFKEFNEKLITVLPMRDVIFISRLDKMDLFHGNLKNEVTQKSTSVGAASHFLQNTVEKDLKIGNKHSFLRLLSVMEEFSESLKELAAVIKDNLRADETPSNGQ